MSSTASHQRKSAAKAAKALRTNAEMIELARAARAQAHAPFSKFKVGAALETTDGRIFTGCNVENSSYGLSICAERVALFKAISEGARAFTRIAVIAETPSGMPVRPCGACRQVISDLMGGEAEVVMANLVGDSETYSVAALLPAPFDASYL